jgi:hypothetical protein
MLILKAISLSPLHGYGILLRIQQISMRFHVEAHATELMKRGVPKDQALRQARPRLVVSKVPCAFPGTDPENGVFTPIYIPDWRQPNRNRE